MKKYILYAIITVAITLSSCTKSLDIANPNTPTSADFWKTEKDATLGVTAVYDNFYRIGSYSRWIYFDYDLRSDEGYSSSPWPELQNWQKFVVVNSNFECGITVWRDHYTGIYRANQVLAYVPQIVMNETLKKRYLAEAKFIRALNYFNLVSLFGNVPLVLAPSKPADLPAYATAQQGWDQIVKDLNEAVVDLPANYAAADVGRATKGAAYALLGKAFLQQGKYQDAKNAFEWLVEGAGKVNYDLMPDYADNFRHFTDNNRESVFEIQFSDINRGPDFNAPGAAVASQRAQFFGPRSIGWSDGQCRRWVADEFLKEKTVDNKRDPRLAVSCLFDNTDERGLDFTMVYGQTFRQRLGTTGEVWFHKYQNDYWRNVEDYYSPINFRVIRYADVLLMYAECLNKLGQTGPAYQYVDRVRERSRMAKLSLVKPGMTQDQFMEQLKHERIVELAGESTRWNDLVRWGDMDTQSKIDQIKLRDPDFDNFTINRDKLLPIPRVDLDLNPNLKQNPNWNL